MPDSRRLKHDARNAIAGADLVLVSAASAWEAAVKQRLGRLQLADSFTTLVKASDFEELPVPFAHAERLAALPPHHSDPFDRMLIAQALVEGCTIVTHDRGFQPYGVPAVWV